MRDAPSYELSYIQNYDTANNYDTLSGSLLQKSHRLLEDILPKEFLFTRILEVGAGSGHHFAYVSDNYQEYIMTDNSDAMLEIASKKYHQKSVCGALKFERQDASALSFEAESFDRLIATHVLEHLANPVDVLKEWDRVVRQNGVISIVLPCDPGMLWRLGRHFGPRKNAQKLGIAYDYLQAAEHINSIFNLVVFIKHHFEVISDIWYPSRLAIPDLNLFYICHLKKS